MGAEYYFTELELALLAKCEMLLGDGMFVDFQRTSDGCVMRRGERYLEATYPRGEPRLPVDGEEPHRIVRLRGCRRYYYPSGAMRQVAVPEDSVLIAKILEAA